MESKTANWPGWAVPLLLGAGTMAWITGWALHLGPTLINDEYGAIDYFYRSLSGGLYPTPDKLHKPLSVMLGSLVWLTGSPLAFELAIAAFASAFVVLAWLVVRRELGPVAAAVVVVLILFHPDLVYLSVTGSSVMIFCSLSFLALYAVLRREESDRWLWVYAASFGVCGLVRPESWLFAAPVLLWWRPRDRRGWTRALAAGALIGLAPLFWFGTDYLINGDLMHGMKIAVRDKTVGMGVSFGPWKSVEIFWQRVANIVSWPVAGAGAAGLAVFCFQRGLRRALVHPFILFPLIISAYLWLIIYQGVFPVQRYFYFHSVVVLFFALHLGVRLLGGTVTGGWHLAGQAGFAAGVVGGGVSSFTSGPGGGLLTATGLVAAAVAIALAGGKKLFQPVRQLLAVGLLVTLALSFAAFSLGYFQKELVELKLEAEKQKQLLEVADWLRDRIGPGQRLLLPNRRNEQLAWRWRGREVPEKFYFREIFYLNYFHGIQILDLQPDWIIWVDNDFQFWGPQKLYGWLATQDRTEIGGAAIELRHSTGLFRVFEVVYPPGYPPKPPLPPIP